MTYEEGYKRIWSVFNSFRAALPIERIGIVLLYLITLYNNRRIREGIGDTTDGSLTTQKILSAVLKAAPADESGAVRRFQKIHDVVAREIERDHVNSRDLGEVYRIISSIDDEWYDKYISRLFDDVLYRFVENTRKGYGEFIQPEEVTKLAVAISGYEGYGSVYNPYAGAASYAVEMNAAYRFSSDEINDTAWSIGTMRLMAHGIDPNILEGRDSYADWRGVSQFNQNRERFDFIISTPPFSMKTPARSMGSDPFRTFRRVEDDFLYRGAMSLNPGGTLVGVFAPGVVFREGPAEKGLRRELVDRGLVSKVILLPDNIFYDCGIPSVIIQLKNAESSGKITMMDASSFFEKKGRRKILSVDRILEALSEETPEYVKEVTIEEVANNSYSLFPPKYFIEEETAPDGFVSLRVSDIISASNSSAKYEVGAQGRMLNLADLAEEPFSDVLDAESLAQSELRPGLSKVTEPFIAVSKTAALRPTLVNASEQTPVFFGSSLSAFTFLNKSVYVPLFLYEWRRRSETLPRVGTTFMGTSITDALGLTLNLPGSYEEQQAMYNRLEQQFKLAKARELGLEELIVSQKKDYINTLRSRKHDLDNCLGAAKNDFSALSKCIKRTAIRIGDSERVLANIPLAEGLSITVGDQLEKIKTLLDRMSVQIKHFTDEDVFGEAEKVDLNAKLNAIQAHGNYCIEHETDLSDMPHESGSILNPDAYAKINASDLDRVIDNIIRNAEKHGFKDPNFRYTMKIMLSYDYNDKMYVIEFMNNGMPMPKGMDTNRYGIDGERGTDSDGLGKGGSIVKGIVEHFGGKYEVYNEPESLFPVGILIKLPKYEG